MPFAVWHIFAKYHPSTVPLGCVPDKPLRAAASPQGNLRPILVAYLCAFKVQETEFGRKLPNLSQRPSLGCPRGNATIAIESFGAPVKSLGN